MSDTAELARRATLQLPKFDETVHPEIMFRAILMGMSAATVADLIGIPLRMLEDWIEQEPKLREAAKNADRADANVLASLYYAAIGWDQYSAVASKKGPNVRAALAWLRERQEWRAEQAKAPTTTDNMTTAQLVGLLLELKGKITTRTGAQVVDVEPTSPAPDTDEDVDAGF